jgi:hypothetical protein
MKARAKSNVSDRVIGTRTARSNAAKNARRGITSNKEPTPQQVALEVQKQTLKTTVKNAAQNVMTLTNNKKKGRSKTDTNAMEGVQASGTKKTLPRKDRVSLRQQQREMVNAATQLAAVTNQQLSADNIPIPTRAMIQAAKNAMISAGYIFPDRTTLHVVPVGSHRTNNKAPGTTTNTTPTSCTPITNVARATNGTNNVNTGNNTRRSNMNRGGGRNNNNNK